MAKYGITPVPAGAPQGNSLRLIGHAMVGMTKMLLRGTKRPSPFFSDTNQPVVEPRVLTIEERNRLREMQRAHVTEKSK